MRFMTFVVVVWATLSSANAQDVRLQATEIADSACVGQDDPGYSGRTVAAPDIRREASAGWVYVAIMAAGSGPGRHFEELWIGSNHEAKWRRLSERRVLATSNPPANWPADIEGVETATEGIPPASREMDERQTGVDTAVGAYIRLAISEDGEDFEGWADDERFLEPRIVAAAHALMDKKRPVVPDLSATAQRWVQALPAHEGFAARMERAGRIHDIGTDIMDGAVARAVRCPFSWFVVDGQPVIITSEIALTAISPVSIVRINDRILAINYHVH